MPPIAYVPVIDEVQDVLNMNSKEPRTKNIKLENGTMFQAGIWYTGMPEEFLNHMKQAVHTCKRMGLFSNYAEALKDGAKALREYNKAVKDIKKAKDDKAPEVEIKAHTEAQDSHLKAVAEHEQERVNAAEGFFSLYANLLSVKARIAWDKTVSHQGYPVDGLEGETPDKGACKNKEVI